MPHFNEIWKCFRTASNNPLDLCACAIVIITSIPTVPLLSLPHCTNFNILSKNVVCRDYPFVSSVYCVSKDEQKSDPAVS